MTTVIWWIRRDLRLQDNPALTAAIKAGEQVIPVFIIDPRLTKSSPPPEKRLKFLWGGLQILDNSLRSRGSRLIIRNGNPSQELFRLVSETKAQIIFAEVDVTPFARKRDLEISQQLPLKLTPGLTVEPVGSVLKSDGNPYTVYTPFSKVWKTHPPPRPDQILPAPDWIKTPTNVPSLPIPDFRKNTFFPPGEGEAQRRLQAFVSGENAPIFFYDEKRNRPDFSSTSMLSPYLHFGMISARQMVAAANQAIRRAPNEEVRKGPQTWLNELIWREFYITILAYFPQVIKESFRPEFRRISWRNDKSEFEAWKAGKTGYPIVDAGMRQLVQTGWMHNRTRMIVASFLVKDLLIDWRWGESWFMQTLIDGDLSANNGGWQWSAGTGTDAAPYFRIFNPVLQGKKFDPHGDYVRRWLPELARIPQKYMHTPWELPESLQTQIGFRRGIDYPHPIVDHALARERTLETFRLAKESYSIT